MSEEEKNPETAAPPQPAMRQFHEETIAGQGFSQYDQTTGWVWIGLKLPMWSFRSAWAFIRSQEFMISSAFDKIEQDRIAGMNFAKEAGKPNGKFAKVLESLRRR